MKSNACLVILMVIVGLGGAVGMQAANVTWTGSNGNAWDTTTVNWTGGATKYTDNDNVRFDETGASRTVNVTTAVSPGSIVVSNTVATPYMFTNSAIGASGSLTKDGDGSLVLGTSNSFAGGITLNAGTLTQNSTYGLGNSSNSAQRLTLAGGVLNILPSASFMPSLYVTGVATLSSGDSNPNVGSGIISGNGTLIVSNNASGLRTATFVNMTLGNDFTGTIRFVPSSDGSIGFRFPSHGNGSTNMTVSLEAVSQSRTVILEGSADWKIGALSGTTDSYIQNYAFAQTYTIGYLNLDTTYAGIIRNNTSLVKVGTGTFKLTNNNTYQGTTTISGGFIAVGGSSALGANEVKLAGGGLAGAFNGGTLSNVINMVSNATFIAGVSSNLTLVNVITNTGALTKTGAGTLTLLATNTYSGATTVSNGTLAITGILSNSPVTVVSGATLAGAGLVVKVVTNAGHVSPGTGTGISGIGTLTVASNVVWNGESASGSSWIWDVDTNSAAADKLFINGNFTKGTGSAFCFDLRGGAPKRDTVYTLVEWTGSSGFAAGDFSTTNVVLPASLGAKASFLIEPGVTNRLKMQVVSPTGTLLSVW